MFAKAIYGGKVSGTLIFEDGTRINGMGREF
jgi:hypothetical protein